MKTIELQVGDKIFNRFFNTLRLEVIRVTKTQAILSNGIRLKRTSNNEFFTEVGPDLNWHQHSYKLKK